MGRDKCFIGHRLHVRNLIIMVRYSHCENVMTHNCNAKHRLALRNTALQLQRISPPNIINQGHQQDDKEEPRYQRRELPINRFRPRTSMVLFVNHSDEFCGDWAAQWLQYYWPNAPKHPPKAHEWAINGKQKSNYEGWDVRTQRKERGRFVIGQGFRNSSLP